MAALDMGIPGRRDRHCFAALAGASRPHGLRCLGHSATGDPRLVHDVQPFRHGGARLVVRGIAVRTQRALRRAGADRSVGAAALGAHVLAKWVPCYVYRLGGKEWPEMPFHLTRLLFFIVLALLLGISQGFSTLLSATALALLGWNLFRARKELAATRLDRTDARSPQ